MCDIRQGTARDLQLVSPSYFGDGVICKLINSPRQVQIVNFRVLSAVELALALVSLARGRLCPLKTPDLLPPEGTIAFVNMCLCAYCM